MSRSLSNDPKKKSSFISSNSSSPINKSGTNSLSLTLKKEKIKFNSSQKNKRYLNHKKLFDNRKILTLMKDIKKEQKETNRKINLILDFLFSSNKNSLHNYTEHNYNHSLLNFQYSHFDLFLNNKEEEKDEKEDQNKNDEEIFDDLSNKMKPDLSFNSNSIFENKTKEVKNSCISNSINQLEEPNIPITTPNSNLMKKEFDDMEFLNDKEQMEHQNNPFMLSLNKSELDNNSTTNKYRSNSNNNSVTHKHNKENKSNNNMNSNIGIDLNKYKISDISPKFSQKNDEDILTIGALNINQEINNNLNNKNDDNNSGINISIANSEISNNNKRIGSFKYKRR